MLLKVWQQNNNTTTTTVHVVLKQEPEQGVSRLLLPFLVDFGGCQCPSALGDLLTQVFVDTILFQHQNFENTI